MKSLVTGADGFIGSHLVELLLGEGHEVVAFCMYNSIGSWGWLNHFRDKEISNLKVVLGDIRDANCVSTAAQGCHNIFHLAALIGIPYSYVAPSSYIETNVVGTLNIVQAAKDQEVERVIHTSTSETYGSARYVPIDEKHPICAQSPYAASKVGADQLALSFWRSFGTPVTVLRPFNTYGPRQSTRAVIPTIISQVLSGNETISLGSLSPTRDFNYVSDTCKAFLSVAASDLTIGEVINASSRFEISIGNTVEVISSVMGRQIHVLTDDQRIRPEKSEVNRLFGDNSKIQALTGWRPEYGGLDGFRRGIEETVEWFKRNKSSDGKRYTV